MVTVFRTDHMRKGDQRQEIPRMLPDGSFIGLSVDQNQTCRTMYGTRRMSARDRLDRDNDYIVVGGKIGFRQTFETVEADETFCRAPDDIINAGRRLLTLDVSSGISVLVHNTVTVKIGCNNIPVFAMVCGGRGRALFSFKCVYSGCSAFMDIRVLPTVDVIKWVVMGISHKHGFSTFPRRIPRNTFKLETTVLLEEGTKEHQHQFPS